MSAFTNINNKQEYISHHWRGKRTWVSFHDSHSPWSAVKKSIDMLDNAKAPNQIVTLQQARNTLQFFILKNIHGFCGVNWLYMVTPVRVMIIILL